MLSRSGCWNFLRFFIVVVYVVLYAILIFVLLRLGPLTMISALFFLNAMNRLCLGSDWKACWAPYGFATIVLLIITASYFFLALSAGTRAIIHETAF